MDLKPTKVVMWSDPTAKEIDTSREFTNGYVVSLTFVNQGTAIVTLNQALKLEQGASLKIWCEAPYHDCSIFKINYGVGTKDLVLMAQVLNGK